MSSDADLSAMTVHLDVGIRRHVLRHRRSAAV